MPLIEGARPLARPILDALSGGAATTEEIASRIVWAEPRAIREEIVALRTWRLISGKDDGGAQRYSLTPEGEIQLSRHREFGAAASAQPLRTRRLSVAYLQSALARAAEMYDAGQTDDVQGRLVMITNRAVDYGANVLALEAWNELDRVTWGCGLIKSQHLRVRERISRVRREMGLIEAAKPLARPILAALAGGATTTAEITEQLGSANPKAVREEIRELHSWHLIGSKDEGGVWRHRLTPEGQVRLARHIAFGHREPVRPKVTDHQTVAFLGSAVSCAVRRLDFGETEEASGARSALVLRWARKNGVPDLAEKAADAVRRAGAAAPLAV